ncbi:MAG TPA: hypothetical protein VK623_02270 [Flavobacterium sp.]|nr:hypothetical protein [Flavobacterium sp.]
MKAGKPLLIATIIVIPMVCFGFLGLRSFTKSVMNSRDCEWANIDNIEMRTQTDIPSTTDCNCNYDKAEEAKKVIFTLDKKNVNLVEYAGKNRFRKVSAAEKLPISDFAFEKSQAQFSDTKSLYYREGQTKWESYKLILNTKTGKLWVYLKYLD